MCMYGVILIKRERKKNMYVPAPETNAYRICLLVSHTHTRAREGMQSHAYTHAVGGRPTWRGNEGLSSNLQGTNFHQCSGGWLPWQRGPPHLGSQMLPFTLWTTHNFLSIKMFITAQFGFNNLSGRSKCPTTTVGMLITLKEFQRFKSTMYPTLCNRRKCPGIITHLYCVYISTTAHPHKSASSLIILQIHNTLRKESTQLRHLIEWTF